MSLLARIRAVFPESPVPREPLLEPVYLDPDAQGDEGATVYFSGKRWTSLDAAGLAYHRIALYMFTPAAHSYYLPAFMSAYIEHPEAAGPIPDDLMSHFSTYPDPFWSRRVEALSYAQREVVASFLSQIDGPYKEDLRRATIWLQDAAGGIY
jgi:hypothetical protein